MPSGAVFLSILNSFTRVSVRTIISTKCGINLVVGFL
jgi:hypothetical protein